jgi:hypothetical protein
MGFIKWTIDLTDVCLFAAICIYYSVKIVHYYRNEQFKSNLMKDPAYAKGVRDHELALEKMADNKEIKLKQMEYDARLKMDPVHQFNTAWKSGPEVK